MVQPPAELRPSPAPEPFQRAVAVGQIYADALFGLAEEAGVAAETLAELERVAELLKAEPDFRELFASPLVPLDRKEATVERAFRGRVGELTCDALMVITRHGRMGAMAAIAGAFGAHLRRARRQIEVRVTSAAPLDEATREAMVADLSARLSATPLVTEYVDPAILGGLVVQVGDEVIDLSVRCELEQIQKSLSRRLNAMTGGPGPLPGLSADTP